MLNFHKPSIADYGWIHDITYPANLPGVDMSFHNMYFWECYYGEVAQAAGFVTQRLSKDGVSTYLYPAGAGDVKPALEEILNDAKARGEKLVLRGVTEDKKALLEELYPGKFSFTAYRDSFDYIYTVEELTELHGKKLQAKQQPLQPLRAGPSGFQNGNRHAGESAALPRYGEQMVRGPRVERAD